ncbi:MAG: UDP-N-acetylmuramoyl-L-alanyl-D-glutamate--2,6-diaminopimelate ligase [Gemmatimonadaceae bacterium]
MSTELTAITDRLRELGLLVKLRGALPERVDAVTDDSRAAKPGTIFVAVRGSVRDGHDYLAAVEAQGAAAAIVEDESRTSLPAIVVNDARRAAAAAAAVINGDPARKLQIIGVTGTNGKTTTVGLLRHLLDEPDARAASIGTLGVLVGSGGEPLDGGSGLTTPGPIELQRVLAALVARGVTRVAMEVSSHSLHQHRVEGIVFAAGVFTNLTRDHLDYHGTMEAYLAAKALLVGLLAPDGVAVVNADDDAWKSLPHAPRRLTFSAEGRDADVRALDVRYRPRGSEWTLASASERAAVKLPLIGAFNVANALGAAGAASAVGVSVMTIAERLSRAPQVPGRLELLHDAPAVLRDYAHTPDALERALDAVRPFATKKLIVVFGAGGDRDKGKRPVMGDIAARKADIAIVTSDNPRTEDPERILDDIEAGMKGRKHERVEDRRAAIARALALAGDDDVIVLAGKGHETYQIRGTVKHHFDEKEIVHELTTAAR